MRDGGVRITGMRHERSCARVEAGGWSFDPLANVMQPGTPRVWRPTMASIGHTTVVRSSRGQSIDALHGRRLDVFRMQLQSSFPPLARTTPPDTQIYVHKYPHIPSTLVVAPNHPMNITTITANILV